MSKNTNQFVMKKAQASDKAAEVQYDSDGSDGSVSDFEPKRSMKVTIKKRGNVQRGHFGELKQGNPGVAISHFNNKLVNFTNRKEASRLWWEQTDAWADRWDGQDSGDEGDAAWANVHLPKTHWKKREAIEKQKKLEEAVGEEANQGPKTKKRKM